MSPSSKNLTMYDLARPFLFLLDPEVAHHLSIAILKTGIGPRCRNSTDSVLKTNLHTKVGTLSFSNPIGLAAGFDKQAEVIGNVLNFGFGATELGSILPKPQPGNPRPRLFRVTEAEAVINRFGFNSDGLDVCLKRIAAYRKQNGGNTRGIVGINVGKNKDSTDAAADYVIGITALAPFADYLTVNISSPNTPGLRDLQRREPLLDLVKQVMAARDAGAKKPPLFIKIAPDLTDEQKEDIAEVATALNVDGLIVGNTTLSRPDIIPAKLAAEAGGLSGKPLFELSTRVLADFYRLTKGKMPLIGCGGVASGADAYAKIRSGATLVQLYSALVYQGPGLIPRINRELATLLKRDGFASVNAAVGSGVK